MLYVRYSSSGCIQAMFSVLLLCAFVLLECWEGKLSCCGLALSYRLFKDYIEDTADCKTIYLGTSSSHALKVECAECVCVCMK